MSAPSPDEIVRKILSAGGDGTAKVAAVVAVVGVLLGALIGATVFHAGCPCQPAPAANVAAKPAPAEPEMVVCPRCKGTTIIDRNPFPWGTPCPECGGTGKVPAR